MQPTSGFATVLHYPRKSWSSNPCWAFSSTNLWCIENPGFLNFIPNEATPHFRHFFILDFPSGLTFQFQFSKLHYILHQRKLSAALCHIFSQVFLTKLLLNYIKFQLNLENFLILLILFVSCSLYRIVQLATTFFWDGVFFKFF